MTDSYLLRAKGGATPSDAASCDSSQQRYVNNCARTRLPCAVLDLHADD